MYVFVLKAHLKYSIITYSANIQYKNTIQYVKMTVHKYIKLTLINMKIIHTSII